MIHAVSLRTSTSTILARRGDRATPWKHSRQGSQRVEEIRHRLYVDDLNGDGETAYKAQHLKESAQTIFSEVLFELQKWHSNIPDLEAVEGLSSEQEPSYAKHRLGAKEDERKMLGMPWNKRNDTIAASFPNQQAKPTKRGIMGNLASFYDPLGRVSPTTLAGKMLYRDVCDSRVTWDKQPVSNLLNRWYV